MAKAKQTTSSGSATTSRPALTPEARDNQMISLAVDLAERQLRDGTASSQVITHYIKMASAKERMELKILAGQEKLIEAKTQALQSAPKMEALYKNALSAMREYGGQGEAGGSDDD